MLAQLQEACRDHHQDRGGMIHKNKTSLRSVRLWIVTPGLVAILGMAFHQYQQYERLGNNLAQIAASCAAKGGCTMPFYGY
jgi:hypothetical protein